MKKFIHGLLKFSDVPQENESLIFSKIYDNVVFTIW